MWDTLGSQPWNRWEQSQEYSVKQSECFIFRRFRGWEGERQREMVQHTMKKLHFEEQSVLTLPGKSGFSPKELGSAGRQHVLRRWICEWDKEGTLVIQFVPFLPPYHLTTFSFRFFSLSGVRNGISAVTQRKINLLKYVSIFKYDFTSLHAKIKYVEKCSKIHMSFVEFKTKYFWEGSTSCCFHIKPNRTSETGEP